MPLYKKLPLTSGRMGILWTCALIQECAILEFGSMGHMVYSEKWLRNAGMYESRLYSAHISEKEIALGIDKKLKESIRYLVEEKKEKVICLIPSSVHEMIGMDLELMVEEIANEYKATKIILFDKGGFKEIASHGVEEALVKLVQGIVEPQNEDTNTFNIIGSCADYARFKSDALEVERIMKHAFHLDLHCALTSNSSIETIETMPRAKINIVLRKEGLKAAKYLEKEFGMPYIYMSMYGSDATLSFIEKVEEELSILYDYTFIENELKEVRGHEERLKSLLPYFPMQSSLTIGGPFDIVDGISLYASNTLGMKIAKTWIWTKEKDSHTFHQDEEMLSSSVSGLMMGSHNLLREYKKSLDFCIVNDYANYELNPYVAPFIGFRGAINLCCMWGKEIYN